MKLIIIKADNVIAQFQFDNTWVHLYINKLCIKQHRMVTLHSVNSLYNNIQSLRRAKLSFFQTYRLLNFCLIAHDPDFRHDFLQQHEFHCKLSREDYQHIKPNLI